MFQQVKCPVIGCTNRMLDWHLTCARHWRQVSKADQDRVYRLYKTEPGSAEHRELCFRILADLEGTANG